MTHRIPTRREHASPARASAPVDGASGLSMWVSVAGPAGRGSQEATPALTLYVEHEAVEGVLRALAPRPDGPAPRALPEELKRLSNRELTVLMAMATGASNAEIAAELFVSVATVKSHVAQVLAKLGLRDRVRAVVFAYESRLVVPR